MPLTKLKKCSQQGVQTVEVKGMFLVFTIFSALALDFSALDRYERANYPDHVKKEEKVPERVEKAPQPQKVLVKRPIKKPEQKELKELFRASDFPKEEKETTKVTKLDKFEEDISTFMDEIGNITDENIIYTSLLEFFGSYERKAINAHNSIRLFNNFTTEFIDKINNIKTRRCYKSASFFKCLIIEIKESKNSLRTKNLISMLNFLTMRYKPSFINELINKANLPDSILQQILKNTSIKVSIGPITKCIKEKHSPKSPVGNLLSLIKQQ